jgi:8-oxo-dGTP diphosphatase
MARVPVMAAGGIVMRREQPPLIAVVRLRKRDEWVLPKGKLDDGETPRAAARREVLEETGHNVTVHEFLGTLVYESGGRSKVVHYWRMEAGGTQTRELMNDIRAVDWLPLDEALTRLSRSYERTFLENVGPLAVSVLSRRLKAKAQSQAAPAAKAQAAPVAKAPAAKKRRVVKTPAVAPQLPPVAPVEGVPLHVEATVEQMPVTDIVEEAPIDVTAAEPATIADETDFVPQSDAADGETSAAELSETADRAAEAEGHERKSLAQKVRNWLGSRAA